MAEVLYWHALGDKQIGTMKVHREGVVKRYLNYSPLVTPNSGSGGGGSQCQDIWQHSRNQVVKYALMNPYRHFVIFTCLKHISSPNTP